MSFSSETGKDTYPTWRHDGCEQRESNFYYLGCSSRVCLNALLSSVVRLTVTEIVRSSLQAF